MDDKRIVRFTTGETVIFTESEEDCKEGDIVLKNPHILGSSQHGAIIVPLVPWARKGKDTQIVIKASLIAFYLPTEGAEELLSEYVKMTSALDLSPLASIASAIARG